MAAPAARPGWMAYLTDYFDAPGLIWAGALALSTAVTIVLEIAWATGTAPGLWAFAASAVTFVTALGMMVRTTGCRPATPAQAAAIRSGDLWHSSSRPASGARERDAEAVGPAAAAAAGDAAGIAVRAQGSRGHDRAGELHRRRDRAGREQLTAPPAAV